MFEIDRIGWSRRRQDRSISDISIDPTTKGEEARNPGLERSNILVTGGAGFIGSHLVDALVEQGHHVRVLDALVPQVHGPGATPSYVNSAAEFIEGDVCDPEVVHRVLDDVDVVFHEAAEVGV